VMVSRFFSCHALRNFFASILREQDGAIFLRLKIRRADDAVVDQREDKAVCKDAAQFFHKVERKRCPASAIGMEESDIGIEADAFQRGCTVMRQHRIGK